MLKYLRKGDDVIVLNHKNLLCVKSIITIMLCAALVVCTFLFPELYVDTFKNAVTMIITFYFVHQDNKRGVN